MVAGSQTFKDCVNQTQTQASEQNLQEYISRIPVMVGTYRDCLGIVFDDHGEAVIAAFTIVLALSTIGLWLSTEKLWSVTRMTAKAAQDSADALPVIERAYIFIKPEIVFPPDFWWRKDTDVAANTISVKYVFTNHGKTPAVIRSIDARFNMWTDAPDNIQHMPSKILGGEPVLEASESTSPDEEFIQRKLTAIEVEAIENGHAYLWFYGSIIYEDIFKKKRVTRFRWRYGSILQHFGPAGTAPYNERT